MDALDLHQLAERDDFATIDASVMVRRCRDLLKSYRCEGRLPWPAATDVRDAHEILSTIVHGMDKKGDKT